MKSGMLNRNRADLRDGQSTVPDPPGFPEHDACEVDYAPGNSMGSFAQGKLQQRLATSP